MKKILGLDLGTNSIGWALVQQDFEKKEGTIDGLGSRIVPMDQAQLSDFGKGNTVSQTAQRTGYRGIRRLYQRDNLRRERLHRVLNILGFLPEHYKNEIDFVDHFGQFKKDKEPKLNYRRNEQGRFEFIFMDSFKEMVSDFKEKQPQLFYIKANGKETKIPYDWTIYYLRKKALTENISKEELAWIILNFNQKRGYYQLRGDELSKKEDDNKDEKYYALKVKSVVETDEKNAKGTWYDVVLENDWIYRRQSKESLDVWLGTIKEFIVTTITSKDGTIKRSFRAPKEDDWGLVKKKTEQEIKQSGKHICEFVYDTLLQNPTQKIRGKLIKTIEREYYKKELETILDTQLKLQPELINSSLYQKCIDELYPRNEAHQNSIKDKDFKYLFVEDIIFYQRPLKSKKSTIGGCQYESRTFMKKVFDKVTNEEKKTQVTEPIKAISKSHPLFQEFRLWQWLQNLRIYQSENTVDGKIKIDVDVTNELLPTENDRVDLFDFLCGKNDINQTQFLKYFSDKKLIAKQKKEAETHRWNYPEDKTYPMCETHASFVSKLGKVEGTQNVVDFLWETTRVGKSEKAPMISREVQLWHIIYSVKNPKEYEGALGTFAQRHQIHQESFIENFKKFSPFNSDYGSYSEKAIKKLLPLMRMGKYFDERMISHGVKERILSIMERVNTLNLDAKDLKKEYEKVTDDDILRQLIKSFIPFKEKNALSGLNTYQACYAVYDRHSESGDWQQWNSPQDIDKYLSTFKQHSLRNPIVEQIVTETLRTVRDIWIHYADKNGTPYVEKKNKLTGKKEKHYERIFDEVHIELGREMKNPADTRKKMSERNTENENTNIRIRELLKEIMNDPKVAGEVKPHSPSHQNLLKIYEEGIFQNPDTSYQKLGEDSVNKIRENKSPTKTNATPTQADIKKYKLWLEQKYISPYTGQPIPLSRLFTSDYQIEHVIPQSRYFDDSFTNKVICESDINQLKDNQTGYEFIKNHGGSIEGGDRIFKLDEYEGHCNQYFKKNRTKLKNLLSEEIPEGFINRQMNDSRYISKLVKGLLGNLVREGQEKEATSKNILPVTGSITAKLKQDWGLNDKWNELILPRFERLNTLTETNDFTYENENGVIVPTVPDQLKSKFKKKRIDHRHHAMDALMIACCTRKHIQYLNSLNNEKEKYNLQPSLMIKNKEGHFTKHFLMPWSAFPADAKADLDKAIVSFKQNLRVINKATNKTWQWVKQKDGKYKKQLVLQTKGDNWAVRKPLHTPLPYGERKYNFSILEISKNIGKRNFIEDDEIRTKVEDVLVLFDGAIGKAESYLKKNPIIDNDENPIISTIFNIAEKRYRKRQPIHKLANRRQGGIKTSKDAIKFINKVSDKIIRNDLLSHLKENEYDIDKAFSSDGIENFNSKRNVPVFKLPISEASTGKFPLGKNHDTKVKFGEAEGGTNLFFAIYRDESENERAFETISLEKVIEHQKWRATIENSEERNNTPMIPVKPEKGIFLFSLSPNDLVYVPTDEEMENPNIVDFENLNVKQVERIVVVNDFSGGTCYFTPNRIAKNIAPKEVDMSFDERKNKTTGSFDTKTASLEGNSIKDRCWKLKVDRLGNVSRC